MANGPGLTTNNEDMKNKIFTAKLFHYKTLKALYNMESN